jgi:hypothetical protein
LTREGDVLVRVCKSARAVTIDSEMSLDLEPGEAYQLIRNLYNAEMPAKQKQRMP